MGEYPGVLNAHVHKGFYEEFEEAKLNFLKFFKETIKKEKKIDEIVIVGYSLGGVYAVLAGLFLKEKFPHIFSKTPLTIFTYGQSRIGDSNLANFISKNLLIYRVTNTDDLVPQLLGIGGENADGQILYTHHDTEYWIAPGSNIVFKCFPKGSDPESKECVNSRFSRKIQKSHKGPYFESILKSEKLKD
ncbi:hypothetical protein G9A89_014716 [Geosiphon pyriformis]|nr:hypothetical protein G9A89_014716 [Geosiphon pyriformis]